MRPGSQFTPKAIQVFKSFATAAPAVMEVGTQSGIPKDLIGGAIGQLCNEEGDATSNGGVPFKAAEIRLYSPPPLKNSKAQVMLLFRGTKFVTVEESIGAGPEGTILFFSSSLLVALPYGVLQEGESNAFRITLCRVERRPDSAILDKSHLPDKELAILEKHANDVEKLKASVSQWPHEGSDNTVYDGTMEYGDYGMVYCFNTNYVGWNINGNRHEGMSSTLSSVLWETLQEHGLLLRDLKQVVEFKYFVASRGSTMRCHVMGPSGHKSEYHCATLLGNWQEERRSFGFVDPAREPLSYMTVYKDSFRGTKTDEELANAKPPSCFHENALPELLFYHNEITNPPKNLLTVNELSYTNAKGGEEVNTLHDILHKEGVSKKRDKTIAIRRELGFIGYGAPHEGSLLASKGATATPLDYTMRCGTTTDQNFLESTRGGCYKPPVIPAIGRMQEKQRLLTTKNVTVDATGEYLKDNIDEYPATSSECWGMFMKFTDNMKGKKLRECYED